MGGGGVGGGRRFAFGYVVSPQAFCGSCLKNRISEVTSIELEI